MYTKKPISWSHFYWGKYKTLFESLTNEQLGEVIKCAMYCFESESSCHCNDILNPLTKDYFKLDPVQTVCFNYLKNDIECSKFDYDAMCERNKLNRARGIID